MPKTKIFRDPIYGYIEIPSEYCEKFIDTDVFQRLRRIEQTSMRVLYPSAHHDRFSHSLGVFFLGKLAFTSLLEKSVDCFLDQVSLPEWDVYKKTFEIACLMHDCGHSPFSHTFEFYYLLDKEPEIREKISDFFEDKEAFLKEYDEASPASHEKISALLLLTRFSSQINSIGALPGLAARMIMGCKHERNLNLKMRIENRLISLLNGSGIDVDSLDYIQRDSWVSGVSNVGIDYQRLLSAVCIKPDAQGNPQIVFQKKVLSVIDNIGLGRNFLYKWIYSHHKVHYEQYLLREIVKKINSDSKDEFAKAIFSFESFSAPQKFQNFSYFLPTDDDLIHSIKTFKNSSEKIGEFLSRQYRFKALWKTYFEFDEHYFESVSKPNRMKIIAKINSGELEGKYGKEKMICLSVEPKLKSINNNEFFIDIDGRLIDASKASNQVAENLSYFILYVTEDLLLNRDEIIKDVLGLQS